MSSKYCSRCDTTKPLSDFWIIKGKPHSYCRDCANAYRNAWYRTSSGRSHQRSQAKLPAKRYALAKYSALKRGLDFTIDQTLFRRLIVQPCTYCSGQLETTGSSLDRKDSSQGYSPANVVPCCGVCNIIKNDTFTYDEMMLLGAVVRDIRKKRPLVIKRGGRPVTLPSIAQK